MKTLEKLKIYKRRSTLRITNFGLTFHCRNYFFIDRKTVLSFPCGKTAKPNMQTKIEKPMPLRNCAEEAHLVGCLASCFRISKYETQLDSVVCPNVSMVDDVARYHLGVLGKQENNVYRNKCLFI